MKNYYIGSSRYALSMSTVEAGRLAVVVQFALETLQSPALREIAQETLTLLTAKSEPTASLVPDEDDDLTVDQRILDAKDRVR